MKKGPPRAPPNGPDCTIPKRGCQAKKEKKFRAQAANLARFLNRAKVEGLARKLTGELGTVPVGQVPCQGIESGHRGHFSRRKVHFSESWHAFIAPLAHFDELQIECKCQ